MSRLLLRMFTFSCAVMLSVGSAMAVLEEPAADVLSPAAAFCVGGTVWHGPSASCVDPELGLVSDDELYAALRSHAYAGRYDLAMRLLEAMRESDTARVLTAEGYILRRTGRVGEGLARYDAALALDPDYHLARAYLGLWHLEQGDRDEAVQQLVEIEKRGGNDGDAWRLLSDAIANGAPRY